jgi:PAS domain S-box-containing protein
MYSDGLIMIGTRTEVSSFFRHLPVFCGLAVALPCIAILIGWEFRIPSLRAPFPVGHPITPWGALVFLLLGFALALFSRYESHSGLRLLATVAAAFVLLHSAATAAEYLLGRDFGIDSLFMQARVQEWWASPAPRGRYALNAAFAFAGIAGALLLRNRRFLRVWASELLAMAVGVLALLGLVGYAYGVHALSGLGHKVWMARNGAVMFGALALGTFFLRCDRGIARLVTAPDAGGVMARRLLLTSMASLFVLGWIALRAVTGAMTSIEIATATLVVCSIIVTAILILGTASVLHRMEQARKQADLALQESAQRLQVATDAAELGIWIWDPEVREVFWSEKARRLFGVEELRDRFDYDFLVSRVHPDDRERVRDNCFHTGPANDYSDEYRIVRDDGAVRWIALNGRRFHAQPGKDKLFGVMSDITERKLSEEALIRNEKLASVGRMAASIAHEVNNPLAAIMNLLFLCRSDPSMSASTRRHVLNAEAELSRVAHITRQTLGFYREQSLPRHAAPAELIQELCELYGRRAGQKDITIVPRARCAATVFGNAGEIRQVISNLIVNAIDAMPSGGTLHLRTSRAGENVRIVVADTGCGIDPKSLSRIFEPFFTTKPTVGTGLGLWISRQIVERHGGRIRVRTKPGKGSVFAVVVPAAAAPKAAAASAK